MKSADRPRIALITNNDDDVYCFRKELIEALLADGYEMLISCPYGPKFALMEGIPYRYDDPEIDRRGTNPIADAKLFLHYRAWMRRERPAVVLTYTAKPNVYASAAAHSLGIPYINNVTGIGSVTNMKGIKRAVILWMFRHAYRRASCVMFQNETNMKHAISAGMVKGAYQLLPGSGVDLERFPLQPYPAGGDGKSGEPVVFNYIGRILRDKGVDDYLEMARRIKRRYPRTEFHMLGFIEPTEIYYQKILEDLERQGIIRYHGSQEDVRPWIARAHAMIHPSVYGEGMSNVLLENASSGRVSITTENPGCRETVVNGESGFLYPGGDVDALTEKVEAFLALDNETRRAMGIRGRQHVEENFSRKLVIEAYRQRIREVIG